MVFLTVDVCFYFELTYEFTLIIFFYSARRRIFLNNYNGAVIFIDFYYRENLQKR